MKIQIPEILSKHLHTKVVFLNDDDHSNNFGYDDSHKSIFDYSVPKQNFGAAYSPYKPPITKSQYNTNIHNKPKDAEVINVNKHKKNKPSFDPFDSDDDKYTKSYKVSKVEKYETETVDNPDSNSPFDKFIVKTKHTVREKLPYFDIPLSYDHEYEYPLSEFEHDYNGKTKVADFSSGQNDPFYGGEYDDIQQLKDNGGKGFITKLSSKKKQKKPKTFSLSSKSPSNEYDYAKNAKLVDYYIAKNKGDADYDYAKSLYGVSPSEKSAFEHFEQDVPSIDEGLDEYQY